MKKFIAGLRRFCADQSGATLIEAGLMLGMIGTVLSMTLYFTQ